MAVFGMLVVLSVVLVVVVVSAKGGGGLLGGLLGRPAGGEINLPQMVDARAGGSGSGGCSGCL